MALVHQATCHFLDGVTVHEFEGNTSIIFHYTLDLFLVNVGRTCTDFSASQPAALAAV